MNNQISEYDKQAEDFLVKHSIRLTTSYLKTDAYWPDDKDVRNIYRWTIRQNGKSTHGTFGASISNTQDNKMPTAYDILSCLTKSDPGDFTDFCCEFGYEQDSMKAFKTYKAVKAEWSKLSRVLTSEAIEDLQCIW